eukprot:scaffold2679_cov251-Pinguiococcus_pyrenoidosus.AAC.19
MAEAGDSEAAWSLAGRARGSWAAENGVSPEALLAGESWPRASGQEEALAGDCQFRACGLEVALEAGAAAAAAAAAAVAAAAAALGSAAECVAGCAAASVAAAAAPASAG